MRFDLVLDATLVYIVDSAYIPLASLPCPHCTPHLLRQPPLLDSRPPLAPRPSLYDPAPTNRCPICPCFPSVTRILGEWISPPPSSAPCRRSPSTITSTAGCAPRPCSS